jgi:hypothetical protein
MAVEARRVGALEIRATTEAAVRTIGGGDWMSGGLDVSGPFRVFAGRGHGWRPGFDSPLAGDVSGRSAVGI